MGEPLIQPLRVRYAECDPQGVVFNANYLAYFDVSITELWRAAFGSYGAMMEKGLDIVVAEVQVRFHGPARFDDALDLEIAIAELGNTAIHSRHQVRREGELLVEGSMRHVVVDLKTLSKTPMPDWLRDGLEPWVVRS